jgi:hypothetical protein
MNDYLAGLVQRYGSRGVLIDTNVLLLFFVGSFDRTQIAGFKRTAAYSISDYDALLLFLRPFHRIVTTPNILSEVNSLSGQMGEPAKARYFAAFAENIGLLAEEYVVSADVAQLEQFPRLGLTDSGILHLVRDRFLVLTDDLPLSGFLEKAGIDVLNFNHLRPID